MTRLHTLTIICDDGTHPGCHDTFAWASAAGPAEEERLEAEAAGAGWHGEWVNVPRPQARWRDFCPVCWAARRDAGRDAQDAR